MVECVYIQTADWAAILDYDPAAKKFKRAFTFDLQTKGVALATAANVLNTQYELQIDQQGSLLVVLLVNSDLGTLGVPDKLVFAAYDHLQSLGIPTIEPTPFVSRLIQGTPGTYYIPIYIPSRR